MLTYEAVTVERFRQGVEERMIFSKVTGAAVLSFAVLSLAHLSPVSAQQTGPKQFQLAQAGAAPTSVDRLRTEAAAVNARRDELFARRDAAGIAAMYTPDATYVELLPRPERMEGHARIEEHFRELFDGNVTELRYEVTNARMIGPDAEITGDYVMVAEGKRIAGHFVQILRREGEGWKIASHVFARPEPVTAREVHDIRGH